MKKNKALDLKRQIVTTVRQWHKTSRRLTEDAGFHTQL